MESDRDYVDIIIALEWLRRALTGYGANMHLQLDTAPALQKSFR